MKKLQHSSPSELRMFSSFILHPSSFRCLLCVLCGLCGEFPVFAGQAPNPAQPPAPQQGNGPNPGQGPGFGPGMGPGPGFMRPNPAELISRMTGVDVANIAAAAKEPKLETLPLGGYRRLVINVPVGGIENPAGTGTGWKVEAVLNLNAEQQAALQALRDGYDKDKKALQKELGDAQNQLAQKAIQLRQAYEDRANALLTGADKELKLKLDALTADAGAKSDALVKDALNLHDPEDNGQLLALANWLRDKMNTLVTQTEASLLQLIPDDRKPVIESVIRNNAQTRQRIMMQAMFGPPGGPGGPMAGRAQQREETVKPPRPPEADKNFDF
jgi:hypothetical protein